jgi:hypothetical protein
MSSKSRQLRESPPEMAGFLLSEQTPWKQGEAARRLARSLRRPISRFGQCLFGGC